MRSHSGTPGISVHECGGHSSSCNSPASRSRRSGSQGRQLSSKMMVGWLICGGSGREVTQAGLGVSSFVQACPAGLQCREQLSKPALSFSRASIREPCPLGSAVTVQRESSQVCIAEGHGRRRHTSRACSGDTCMQGAGWAALRGPTGDVEAGERPLPAKARGLWGRARRDPHGGGAASGSWEGVGHAEGPSVPVSLLHPPVSGRGFPSGSQKAWGPR